MLRWKNIILLAFFLCICLQGRTGNETTIPSLPGEKWWGGMVALGSQMPFADDLRLYDLSRENLNNQNVPLLLSSEGRYI